MIIFIWDSKLAATKIGICASNGEVLKYLYNEMALYTHKKCAFGMLQPALFLRDMIDNMCQRKLRENTDFEWRRNLRLYLHEIGEEL